VQTSSAYKLDIARFVGYASVKGAKAPIDVGARTLREYVYHLKDLGLSAASIRRNVSAVRSYFKFLLAEGHVVRDPSERLETPKKWRTLPEVLAVEEIEKLLRLLRSTSRWRSATGRCSSSPTAPACASRNGSRSAFAT
jgi:integrase/recombinase XerD